MVKRIYFFKDGTCFQYDPRPATDRVVASSAISARFNGLNTDFQGRIDAALNWGDGSIDLFRRNEVWEYDALKNRVRTPNPRKIADIYSDFPADFKKSIDAAFNTGTGKAYFFKDDRYLRYNVGLRAVDAADPGTAPYPRKISDPNGWRGLTPDFAAGLDAAAFAGDDKIYFFKGTRYARLTFSKREVDVIDPPYPRPINPAWSGLPAEVDAAVEWIQAGGATLTIGRTSCQHIPVTVTEGVIRQPFTIDARFTSTGYPSLCACAEYRQYVQGHFKRNGVNDERLLANPAGGAPIKLLDRPPPGSTVDNFREDGRPNTVPPFYGHRDAVDPNNTYSPDAATGCTYHGSDPVFIGGPLGQSVEVLLDFRGVVIDVAADNEELARQTWTVWCPGPI